MVKIRLAGVAVVILLSNLLSAHGESVRYIVRFKREQTSIHELTAQSAKGKRVSASILGSPVKRMLDLDNSAVVEITPKQLKALKKRSDIESVEEDVRVTAYLTPNDPSFPSQYGMSLINAPSAWDVTTGDPNVVIGVIDTGAALSHPDLQETFYHNAGEIPGNGFDDDGDGYVDNYIGWNFVNDSPDTEDDNGHGTHCAGVVGATGNNSQGVAGVAFSSKVMPLKALGADGAGFFSDVAAAILYAVTMKQHGVNIRILSLSLGGPYSAVLDRAVKLAETNGILLVAAAGNDGTNNDKKPAYPASLAYNNVISVAAVDSFSNMPSFSNYGRRSVDLAAPGIQILSTFPVGIRSTDGYGVLSGTSMAAPHVAGGAALVLSANPSLTMTQVRNALLSTVTPQVGLVTLVSSGGVLNTSSAVQSALGTTPLRSVLGQVTQNKKTKVVKDATVTLKAKGAAYKKTTTTDAFGGFLFDDVISGQYTVTVKKKDFLCKKAGILSVFDENASQNLICNPVAAARR